MGFVILKLTVCNGADYNFKQLLSLANCSVVVVLPDVTK